MVTIISSAHDHISGVLGSMDSLGGTKDTRITSLLEIILEEAQECGFRFSNLNELKIYCTPKSYLKLMKVFNNIPIELVVSTEVKVEKITESDDGFYISHRAKKKEPFVG